MYTEHGIDKTEAVNAIGFACAKMLMRMDLQQSIPTAAKNGRKDERTDEHI